MVKITREALPLGSDESEFYKTHDSVYTGALTTGRFNGVSASAEVKPRASLYTRCHAHSGGFKGAEFARIGKLQSHRSSVESSPDTIQASLKSWQFFKTFVSGVKAQHTESSGVAGNVLDYCL